MDVSLIKMKEKLESIKDENQENIAMRNVLLQKLKDEFDLDSIEDAEEYIEQLEMELEQKTGEYEENKNELFKKIKESGILD